MTGMLWIILIIVFAVIEIATVGLTSIWFAGGALAALLCYAVGLGDWWQFLVFVVVSLGLICFTRPWALKYLKPRLTRTNYEEAIDANVCVTEDVDNLKGTGTAVYKGQEWTARAYEERQRFEAGTIVRVKEIRGVTLYVVASEIMPQQKRVERDHAVCGKGEA